MQLSLSEHDFKAVQGYKDKIPECICLLKRQTINTNRAVCVVQLPEIPSDINSYISSLRTRVAFKVGFFPLLWDLCSGQLIPDSDLGFSSATAGAIPPL